ncbi:MAG: phosphopyruvate hydratase [bacterium]
MPIITQIVAHEIIDSRGNPTIETSVLLDTGHFGTASIPSGASTGQHEAVELRDGDQTRFMGMGVTKAIDNVLKHLAPKLLKQNVLDQAHLDRLMIDLDGHADKSKLGANAILSLSIACLKAAASSSQKPLFLYIRDTFSGPATLSIPSPLFNLINGGKHGAGNLNFQEFHVIPSTRFPFSKAYQIGVELFQFLKLELIRRNAIHSVGDEGGFAPNLFTNSDALELLELVIKNSPYRLDQDVYLGLDVAAGSFYKDGKYTLKDSPKSLDQNEMINFYLQLLKAHNLFSLEDPLYEDDWSGWTKLHQALPSTTMVIGDDLITTNVNELKKAIETKACNSVIVKPNQIGTVTETVELVKLAQSNNIYTVFSHRSGETNDHFIADFAVGLGANFVKFGAPDRGERVAKYNRLLEIETYLNRQQ